MKKKLFFSIALSAFFLWLVLRGLNFHEIAEAFRQVNWLPVAFMPLTMISTHYFRARRWKFFVDHIRKIGVWEMFKMNMIGFMSISLFPLRLGEVTRPLLLKKRHDIPFATGLATIALERVFDALVTALILVFGLLASPFIQKEIPGTAIRIKTMVYSTLGIIVIAFTLLGLAVVARNAAKAFVIRISKRLPQRFHHQAESLSHNFFVGLESIPGFAAFLRVFAESLGVWGTVAVGYLLAFRAFGLHLHWSAVFSVVGIAAAGVSIPAAPGAVGTLHAAMLAAVMLYGVDQATGLAFAIVAHAVNFLFTIFAGLVFVPSMSIRVGKLYDEASHQT